MRHYRLLSGTVSQFMWISVVLIWGGAEFCMAQQAQTKHLLVNVAAENEETNIKGGRINLLYGVNGSLDGLDIGTLNVLSEDLKGVQLALLGNIVDGEIKGLQASPLVCRADEVEGLQFVLGHGLFSHDMGCLADKVKGFQLAPIGMCHAAELVGGQIGLATRSDNLKGFEMAGVVSFGEGPHSGLILTGIYSGVESRHGVSVSGIVGHNEDFASGIQIDGLVHSSTEAHEKGVFGSGLVTAIEALDGIGFSGIWTDIEEEVKGVSCSLLVTTSGRTDGLQVSGAYNYAEEMSGVQAALVTRSRHLDKGIQLGLLNFADNGILPVMPLVNFNFDPLP